MSDERDWRRRRSPHGDRPSDPEQPTERMSEQTASISGSSLPFDMSDVHIDDQFLDALSAGQAVPTRDDTEYELAELMSGWRREVLATPAPPLPSVDEVQNAIAAADKASRPRGITRHLRVASGVAAVVVVAIAGLTVLSEGSQPGDPLWGVKSVVFASAASETQASVNVQSNLEKAEAAIAAGNTSQAQTLVAQAEKDLGPVRNDDTRNRMNDWITRLRADVTSSTTKKPATTSKTSPSTVTTTDEPETGQQTDPSRDRDRLRERDRESQTKPSIPETSVPVSPPSEVGEQPPVTTTPTPTSANQNEPAYPVAPQSSWTTTTPVWPN